MVTVEIGMRKTRKLHINGVIWVYVIGRSCVAIFHPRRLDVRFHTLLGLPGEVADELAWNRSLHITPSDVCEYIINNLL